MVTVYGFSFLACHTGGCNNCRCISEQRLGRGANVKLFFIWPFWLALLTYCFYMIMIIQQDFPEDKTGRFNGLKNFIGSNFELCKWISLVIVVAQVCFFIQFIGN